MTKLEPPTEVLPLPIHPTNDYIDSNAYLYDRRVNDSLFQVITYLAEEDTICIVRETPNYNEGSRKIGVRRNINNKTGEECEYSNNDDNGDHKNDHIYGDNVENDGDDDDNDGEGKDEND